MADSLELLRQSCGNLPVLDLACGGGRNGSFLADQGLSVIFADRNQAALDDIAAARSGCGFSQYWAVDFEADDTHPLVDKSFGAILVFRYLHRPLMHAIKKAVQPGGIAIYETFTTEQPRFGRPSNPDFLLQPGELAATFSDWEVLHGFEGTSVSETSGNSQAIAQLVARKPDASTTSQSRL